MNASTPFNITNLLLSEGKSDTHLYSLVARAVPDQARRIVDLGCGGYGYLENEKLPFEFVQADLNSKLPYSDSSFDCVTAIEVIEHLENPRHFAREIHRITRPGGSIIISTPNPEALTSLLSLLFRGYFSAFSDRCYPAHITPVLQIDLKRILQECGFEVQSARHSNRGRIPGMNLHWQKVIPFLKGTLFSDNYLMVAIKTEGQTE